MSRRFIREILAANASIWGLQSAYQSNWCRKPMILLERFLDFETSLHPALPDNPDLGNFYGIKPIPVPRAMNQ